MARLLEVPRALSINLMSGTDGGSDIKFHSQAGSADTLRYHPAHTGGCGALDRARTAYTWPSKESRPTWYCLTLMLKQGRQVCSPQFTPSSKIAGRCQDFSCLLRGELSGARKHIHRTREAYTPSPGCSSGAISPTQRHAHADVGCPPHLLHPAGQCKSLPEFPCPAMRLYVGEFSFFVRLPPGYFFHPWRTSEDCSSPTRHIPGLPVKFPL